MRAGLAVTAGIALLLSACGKSGGGSGSSSGSGTSTSTSTGTTTGTGCACPEVACSGRCVDLASDALNCGGCGVACTGPCGSTQCQQGTCQPPPYWNCSSGATSGGGTGSTSGSGTSGSTGTGCSASCTSSAECPAGYTCEPPAFPSSSTGGTLGNRCQACEPPMIVCGGQCVHSDQVDHCGACGNACGPFQACVHGQCACKTQDDGCGAGCRCQPGQHLCGDRCSDPSTDDQNCGGCDLACAPNQRCVSGACAPGDAGAPLDAFALVDVLTHLGPTSLAAADLNQDGRPDLAVATDSSTLADGGLGAGELLVKLGAASGLGATQRLPGYGESLAVADLDGDGKLDLVTADMGNDRLIIVYGDGQGGFASTAYVNLTAEPEVVRVADFNGDGRPDLFVEALDYSTGGWPFVFEVALQLATPGAFGAPIVTPDTLALASFYRGQDGVVGDLNGDGKADVAAGSQLFLGQGDGTFAAPVDLGAGSVTTAADVDGDGHLDLVALGGGDPGDGCLLDALRVRFGYGDGGFSAGDAYPLPQAAHFAVAGHFTGGARPDLAVVFDGYYSGLYDRVMLLRNDGSGHLALDLQQYLLGDGGYPAQGAAADFNGDGKDDLAVTELYAGQVKLLLSR